MCCDFAPALDLYTEWEGQGRATVWFARGRLGQHVQPRSLVVQCLKWTPWLSGLFSLSLVYSARLPILLPMSPSNLVTYLSTARQSLIAPIRLSRSRFARLMCIHLTCRELSTSRILPPTEDAEQRAKRHQWMQQTTLSKAEAKH